MIWQPEDLQVQRNKNQDGSIGYLSEPMLPFLHFDFQQFMLTLVEACDAVMLGRWDGCSRMRCRRTTNGDHDRI